VTPSNRAERQFGYAVGAVFLAAGLWTGWRGTLPIWLSTVAATLGLTLVLLGWTVPGALRQPRRRWMALAEGLSWVSTRCILAVVFFIVVAPLGLTMRLFGWDPLTLRRPGEGSLWVDYPERQHRPRHFDQMF
jgi:hypothetical protein